MDAQLENPALPSADSAGRPAGERKRGLHDRIADIFPRRPSDDVPTPDTPLLKGSFDIATYDDRLALLSKDYDIRGYLGEGLTGYVVQAVNRKTGKRVAIKFLKPEAEEISRAHFSFTC